MNSIIRQLYREHEGSSIDPSVCIHARRPPPERTAACDASLVVTSLASAYAAKIPDGDVQSFRDSGSI